MDDGITIVKCGGSVVAHMEQVCDDLAKRRARGERAVLVHGGGPDIDALAADLGITPRTLVSPDGMVSRHTDAALRDVVTMAMTGRVKPRLLAALNRAGVPAVGLTGLDGGLLSARRKTARRSLVDGRTMLVRDDYSGKITGVDPLILRTLLDAGVLPVVSPPAAGPDGEPLNVDADRAAAAVAVALRASRLLLLTAAPGLLADPADEASVLPRCTLSSAADSPYPASGGMFRKLVAAVEALRGGVPVVRISDGRTSDPVTGAINGAGTTVLLGPGEPLAHRAAQRPGASR